MANTIAHLCLAQHILSLRPELVRNRDSFYLGCIAPDAIESKQGAVRDDKKHVHLRLGITDMEWLEPDKMAIFDERLQSFFDDTVKKEQDEAQRDFLIGYYVHLLTDKLHHAMVRHRILKIMEPLGYEDGTWDFIYIVLDELAALDHYLLQSRADVAEIFLRLLEGKTLHWLPGMIEKEYLEKSLIWWKTHYIPLIAEKEARVLAPEDIESFVQQAAELIVSQLDSLL